jgi:hypothetical protein
LEPVVRRGGSAAHELATSGDQAVDERRLAELEEWIFDQGRVVIYDNHHHPKGWMALAVPPALDYITANPPFGLGPTKIDALEALCMVLGGEPGLPPG